MVANLIASRLTVLYGPSGVGKSSLLARRGRALAARRSRSEPLVVVFSSVERRSGGRALAEAVGRGCRARRRTAPRVVTALELAQSDARRVRRPRPGRGVLPLPRGRRRAGVVRRGAAGGCGGPVCASTSCSPCERTRSRGSTASRGGSRPLREHPPPRPPRPRRGASGDPPAVERFAELTGEAVDVEPALVDRV